MVRIMEPGEEVICKEGRACKLPSAASGMGFKFEYLVAAVSSMGMQCQR